MYIDYRSVLVCKIRRLGASDPSSSSFFLGGINMVYVYKTTLIGVIISFTIAKGHNRTFSFKSIL